ncbi:MAG: ATP-binding protein [Eubacteriales bacterium]|nr:ATP-binding protein [Eubacteriales bacterium]
MQITKAWQWLTKNVRLLKNRKSTQETIPYINEYKDGILEVSKNTFSKTIRFSDINYSTARKDEQESTFMTWCELLNSYNANVGVQVTINLKSINKTEFEKAILLEDKEDNQRMLRKEFNSIQLGKIEEGKNNISKDKYITLTMTANSYEAAKDYFTRLEIETINLLKKTGSRAHGLDLSERMEIFHGIYRNGNEGLFNAEVIMRDKKHGLTAKDSIAADGIGFKRNHFIMGDKYAQVLFVREYPTFLADKILDDLTNFRFNMTLSITYEPVEPSKALKLVTARITSMEADKMNLQNKARNKGQLEAYIPHKLRTALSETEELLDDIVNKDQKLFLTTITILHIADTKEALELQYDAISQAAAKNLCQLGILQWQQEKGLNNVLPYGLDTLKINRCLTTESAAIFIPFSSLEIFQKGGVPYGQHAVTHNIIAINRKLLKTPSGFILGTPGSGKSMEEKIELLSILLGTEDDVIIIDPEREYTELVQAFGGEVIHISAASKNYINPLDLTETYSDDDAGQHDPLLVKSDFILSLFDILIGGKDGLDPIEISIIDRCVKIAYKDLFDHNFDPAYTPILEDLYDIIKQQPEQEAAKIASSLELYVLGTLKVFSNKTNVKVNNRLICFDTKDLGKNLKTAGMLIVMDAVWNRITANREAGKRTWLPIDEIQVFFSNKLLEGYFDEIWRRFRKWGGIPTGITQNVTPLLKSDIAYNMLQNSEFVVMMNQATQDRQKLAEMFGISDSQMEYITNSEQGHGLICAGGNIIPFENIFPRNTQLYRMMTTKIEEISSYAEKKTWSV